MYRINIPAGKAHQGFAAIFNPNPGSPRTPNVRLHPDDGFYGMWVEASCVLNKYPDFPVKPKETSAGEGFYLKSKSKPTLALEMDRSGKPMDMMVAAAKFERMFHDLHWIGVTPDEVIRFTAKTVLFDIHQKPNTPVGKKTLLVLRGVMMHEQDILREMQRIKDECFRDGDLL